MLVLLSIIGQASTPSYCLCLLVQSSIISHIQRRIRTVHQYVGTAVTRIELKRVDASLYHFTGKRYRESRNAKNT